MLPAASILSFSLLQGLLRYHDGVAFQQRGAWVDIGRQLSRGCRMHLHSIKTVPSECETSLSPFRNSLEAAGLSDDTCEGIIQKLVEVELLNGREASPTTLLLIAQDFMSRPEAFATLLIADFEVRPLWAHQIRAVVMIQLQRQYAMEMKSGKVTDESAGTLASDPFLHQPVNTPAAQIVQNKNEENAIKDSNSDSLVSIKKRNIRESFSSSTSTQKKPNNRKNTEEKQSKPTKSYKSLVLSPASRKRRSDNITHDYGLPSDYETRFPTIALELNDFYTFMTRPATSSQDEPIRPATAKPYMSHAKQFLGWYATQYNIAQDVGIVNQQLSLFQIFPNKEKESADPVLEFILWLRSTRSISKTYEANILRGLTKLLKFRFSKESQIEPGYGDKSFDDIPLIREIRKLHREANKKAMLAPRSSDEKQKWLSWPEYLQVVQKIQKELVDLMKDFNQQETNSLSKPKKNGVGASLVMQRKIAVLFQKYLILAIFSSVPDRQRTIRELEVDRNFIKDDASGCWCIKHAPEDYKTGKAYGERPPLQLAGELTPWIDDFIENWREYLSPISLTLFVQSKTGKALTQNSVYQYVSRCCFDCTGKRTNPHLLRDMLVTHVRESNASEKQLEALALYMGHSIQMQRSSYDRRTLNKKVAPAVELMQTVNNGVTVGDAN